MWSAVAEWSIALKISEKMNENQQIQGSLRPDLGPELQDLTDSLSKEKEKLEVMLYQNHFPVKEVIALFKFK